MALRGDVISRGRRRCQLAAELGESRTGAQEERSAVRGGSQRTGKRDTNERETGKSTHLLLAAKESAAHVAYQAALALVAALLLLSMVVAVRQVLVASMVRHADRSTAPGCGGR